MISGERSEWPIAITFEELELALVLPGEGDSDAFLAHAAQLATSGLDARWVLHSARLFGVASLDKRQRRGFAPSPWLLSCGSTRRAHTPETQTSSATAPGRCRFVPAADRLRGQSSLSSTVQ